MEVGAKGSESTLENALSRVRDFGLQEPQARAVAREVAAVVQMWKSHFLACDVRVADIEALTRYLDSDTLSELRRNALL